MVFHFRLQVHMCNILFVAITFIAVNPMMFSYHNIRNNYGLKNEAQLTLRCLDFGLNTVWSF